MIWGMTTATFTIVHVVLSLVGLVAGLVAMSGMLAGKQYGGWTALFLATLVATSVTGFGFPVEHVLPSHIVGVGSLLVLGVAILARYAFRLEGGWRPTYVVCAGVALYLDALVAVVQAFQRIPALRDAAPTQKEPPFLVAQVAVLAAFAVLTIFAARRFHAARA
jgi:hypothetical protein